MIRTHHHIRISQVNDVVYELFRVLVLERTGMHFPLRRRDDLVRSVLTEAGRSGFENIEAYYHRLSESKTDSVVWNDLIRLLIVNETYFFRDTPQIDVLRLHILPDIISRHREDRCLRIWSAGCAGGEEPYSLAIMLTQLLPDIHLWNVFILGTDINRSDLLRAERACYRERAFRLTDPLIRKRFFTPGDGGVELEPRIRKMVRFAYLNLADDVYPSPATNTTTMDLILCRNVAIYFDDAGMMAVAERFHRSLVTDGWYMVGAAEAGSPFCFPFVPHSFPDAIVYRKGVSPLLCPDLQAAPQERDFSFTTVCDRFHDYFPVQEEPVKVQPPRPPTPEPPWLAEKADPYKEGLIMMGKGNYEGAIERFQARIAGDRGFVPAYCEIARANANRGRLEEADSWCERAIEIDPLTPEAYHILALIRQEEGDPEKAVHHLKKALYLDPNFILAHFSLSVIHRRAGRREESMRHGTQVLRLCAELPPDEMIPGSEGLTAAHLLKMLKAMK